MKTLKNEDGQVSYPKEGGSALLQFKLYDATGTQLAETAILTLTCTLKDVDTDTVINSRDGESILDANGGSVDPSGDVDLVLSPLDNVIVTAGNSLERHAITIEWTWNDDGGNPYAGIEEFEFQVAAVDDASPNSCIGWLG